MRERFHWRQGVVVACIAAALYLVCAAPLALFPGATERAIERLVHPLYAELLVSGLRSMTLPGVAWGALPIIIVAFVAGSIEWTAPPPAKPREAYRRRSLQRGRVGCCISNTSGRSPSEDADGTARNNAA